MKLKFLISLLLTVSGLTAQQIPPSVSWMQYNSDNFKIIFPKGLNSTALYTLSFLEKSYRTVSKDAFQQPDKVPVVIYNQTVISNGYASLTPRKMGFFTTPPQDVSNSLEGNDWLQTLSIHELRHITQFSLFDKGFTQYCGALFGGIGKSLAMNFVVPAWYFEGDAIYAETKYSLGGRGRQPGFFRGIKALELEGKRYSYDKAFLGSYKHYFPNHYHLGYLMSSHVNKNYGYNVWDKILDISTSHSYFPFTFSIMLWIKTENNLRKTYAATLDEYSSFLTEQTVGKNYTKFNAFELPKKKVWTNYSFPFQVGSNSIIALKSGLAHSKTIVKIENGDEEILAHINTSERIHSNGQFVVWPSKKTDIRWSGRSYSDIIVYNIETNRKTKITRKKKYFAPAISPDGTMIAVIEYGKSGICALVIISSENGNELKRFTFKRNEIARMPSWSEDQNHLVYTRTKGQYKHISILNIEKEEQTNILSQTTENITNPVFYENYVLFNAPYSGTEEIHAINIDTKKRTRVINDEFGVNNVSVSLDKEKLIFQNYTTQGFSVSSIETDTTEWVVLNESAEPYVDLFEEYSGIESYNEFNSIRFDTSSLTAKKYFPLLNSIKVHSWYPYPIANGIGLSLFSNDLLSTTSIRAGIEYYAKEFAHREYLNLYYSKFYPVINAGFSYGRKFDDFKTTRNIDSLYSYNEKLISGGVSLPLNLSGASYNSLSNVYANYFYVNHKIFLDSTDNREDLYSNSYVNLGFKYSIHQNRSLRDKYPRFGQDFSVNTYFDSLSLNNYQFTAQAKTYLPGIFPHHSTQITFGLEQRSNRIRRGIYTLSSELSYVRGYARRSYDNLKRGTFIYSFPLLYPDFGIGPIVYFKRLRSDLFFDYGYLSDQNTEEKLYSVGVDLNSEMNFLRIPYSLEFGLRASYLIGEKSYVFEILVLGTAF